MNKINKQLKSLASSTLLQYVIATGLMSHFSPVGAVSSCSINGAGLTFPSYETFSSNPTLSTGSVGVQCTNIGPLATTGDTISLKIGGGSYGTVSNRKMASGTDYLYYGIYSENGQFWDDVTGVSQSTGSLTVGATKNMTFNLYGRIRQLQNVRAGSYSDNVMITITP